MGISVPLPIQGNISRALLTTPTATWSQFTTLGLAPLGTFYDARSRLKKRIDAEVRTTEFEYDTLDRLITTLHPQVPEGTPVERVVYDDVARTQLSIDAEQRETLATFDLEGRVVQVDNAEGGTKIFDYDLAGNKELESSWFDRDTSRLDTIFTYDDAGRLEYRIEPLGRQTHYEYDAVGNLEAETLEDTQSSLFVDRRVEHDYDELNRKIGTRRFLGSRPIAEEAVLDGEGNAVLLRDALGRETNQRFDALNRRIEVLEPPLASRKTPRHRVHLRRKQQPNPPDAAQRRPCPRGQRSGDSVPIRRTQSARTPRGDPRHGPFREDDLWVGTRSAISGSRSIRVCIRSPTPTTLSIAVEQPSSISSLSPTSGGVVTEMNYDLVGNKVEELHPNGNVVTHRYDDLNRLEESSDSLGTLGLLTYDARGNQLTATDANGNLTVSRYDDLDRLYEQDLPEDRQLTFSYDAAGNRLTSTDARGNTTSFVYDTLNRLIEVSDPAPFADQKQTFAYDDVGNQRFVTNRRGHTTENVYNAPQPSSPK